MTALTEHSSTTALTIISSSTRWLKDGTWVALGTLVLAIVCSIGWIYGVFQNRSLRGSVAKIHNSDASS